MRSSSPSIGSSRILLSSATLLLFATAAFGQGGAPRSRSSGPQDIQSREWALTHISDGLGKHYREDSRTSLPQMREDFRQLQVLSNELMKSVFVKNSIEPKRIIASATEIRKRAARLKTGLALSGESENKKSTTGGVVPEGIELSSMVLLLDRAVTDFVNNPLFQQPKVLDTRLAGDAENELVRVLRLTELISQLMKQQVAQK